MRKNCVMEYVNDLTGMGWDITKYDHFDEFGQALQIVLHHEDMPGYSIIITGCGNDGTRVRLYNHRANEQAVLMGVDM